MKIIAITQARYGSSRLPGKVLMHINGISLLQIHLERVRKSNRIDEFIIATTFEKEANRIIELAERLGVSTFRGSTENVLERFYLAAKEKNPDYVVRVTSDCPLIDSKVIDSVIDKCIAEGLDYCSNTLEPTFPDGCDIEIFRFDALEKAFNCANLSSEKEHVTPYIWKNSSFLGGKYFRSDNFYNKIDYSKFRLTVDEQSDFELITKLVEMLGYQADWQDYIAILENDDKLFNLNSQFKRNEGLVRSMKNDKIQLRHIDNFSESDKYRTLIHNLIPGGAHTYSKGDDQFPKLAPAAISHGTGAYLWDIDNNKFLDCSMGLTSVSLGHAYQPVLDRVKQELELGVNFQRPSVLEREMAEKFLSIVPQHDMVKFAKNGSIVTTAAVKLARAFTNRKLVAFPGDHPFYSYDDWFIGKTACNKGVPDEISELSVTFKSCDIASLKTLFDKYPGQIACVIMEPEKNQCSSGCNCSIHVGQYLKQAIQLTHENGALFILDEMVTGFKTAFPGSIKKYDLEPDMATWGKGIANGFSFCALTGKREVMQLGGILNSGSEKVFLISTTHGGETHAMAAAIATINEFQKFDVIEHNHNLGKLLIQSCRKIIDDKELADYIQVTTSEWMPLFIFKDMQMQISAGFRTLAMQEMIRRGVLFQGIFVPSFSHTKEDIEYFAEAFRETLEIYKSALQRGFESFLIGETVKPVFRKIT
jgi:glutamate-1-semialdehyde aminotransferase/spore coat polysaccharide biosynthesis protein SpsF (cytidylyltransferase family)